MKCVASLASIALTLAAGHAGAQEAEPRNALQADLGLAVIAFGFERVLGDRFALQAEAGIFGTWFGPPFGFADFTGFGGGLRASAFLVRPAPYGLYVTPFVRVDRVTGEANGVKGTTIGWSAGAFVGWSFPVLRVLNVRVGAGAQYLSYVAQAGPTELRFRNAFPAIDLVVGYTF